MRFSEELKINAKKWEIQPTYSDLVLYCHIARRWLSTGIILRQRETDHKQWAFPLEASQSLLILHCFGILLGWTPNHLPTLLTHVLHGLFLESHWWSLKCRLLSKDTIMLVSWGESKLSRRCWMGLSSNKAQILIMALMIIPIF